VISVALAGYAVVESAVTAVVPGAVRGDRGMRL
jgi:hypothetical protein